MYYGVARCQLVVVVASGQHCKTSEVGRSVFRVAAVRSLFSADSSLWPDDDYVTEGFWLFAYDALSTGGRADGYVC
jgi:hypothetical protein